MNGVLRVILQIPKLLGLIPGVWDILDSVYEFMMKFEETTYISDDIKYNAFISMFSYFYIDGGVFGVFLFSTLFGWLCSLLSKRAINAPTYQSCGLLLYTAILISNSMVRAQSFLVPPVMSMVLVYLLLPTTSIKIDNYIFIAKY